MIFTKLAPLISLSTSTASGGTGHDPTLIVVFGWLEAPEKRLLKYCADYRNLYPSSPILLLRSTTQSLFFGKASALEPARDFILSALGSTTTDLENADVLLHAFSSGGCMELIKLNSLFLANRSDPSPSSIIEGVSRGVPGRLLLLDSCPGGADLRKNIKAFTGQIRVTWIRWGAKGLVGAAIGSWILQNKLAGKAHPLRMMANSLVEDLPTTTPRLYLYSTGDLVHPPAGVEDHIKQSLDAGLQVAVERWENTAHVGHAKEGGGVRYWTAINKMWEKARVGKWEKEGEFQDDSDLGCPVKSKL